jgi:hypothetical protein
LLLIDPQHGLQRCTFLILTKAQVQAAKTCSTALAACQPTLESDQSGVVAPLQLTTCRVQRLRQDSNELL